MIDSTVKTSSDDPHATQPLISMGPRPELAKGTIVFVHGRGASAESILSLHEELGLPDFAALAPQAAESTWYPNSFMAKIESNQPWLDSALSRLEGIVSELIKKNVSSKSIALLGFSQGACLALEYAARHPRHYGAVIGFTGGLIGESIDSNKYRGSLDGTEVLLASGDPDPHVPFSRVEESQKIFEQLAAKVQLKRYPGLPHTINKEEIELAREILKKI